MRKLLIVLLIIFLVFVSSIPVVFASIPIEPKETTTKETPKPTPTPEIKQPDENTTISYIYEGDTKITSTLNLAALEKSKTELSDYEKSQILSSEILKILINEKYPNDITDNIRIEKYRCDEKLGVCGYWIYASRNGYQIAVNNPIWISPPPYLVVLNDEYDPKLNQRIVTVKEDPKAALLIILQRYVDSRPLGPSITGSKE